MPHKPYAQMDLITFQRSSGAVTSGCPRLHVCAQWTEVCAGLPE